LKGLFQAYYLLFYGNDLTTNEWALSISSRKYDVSSHEAEVGDISFRARWIAALTDPVKLATLKGDRAANPRLQKCIYWLAYAEEQGEKPEAVLDESAKLNKTEGTPYAGFIRWGLLENLKIAKELGLLTPEGMAELRRGKSATITQGQYVGQEAEADHVIPRAICPELKNQVMNLELLPASLNRAKSDKVTERAKVFAKELYDAKLLSEEGWKATVSENHFLHK
jgi:hypothetical protein